MGSKQDTLIVGGTGKTGRRVAQRLSARGVPVRIASRSATPPFDWERPGTWRDVLEGVASVYLTYHPDLAAPGAAENVRAFANLAADRGVRRIVLLSGRGEPQVLPAEDAVRGCGVAYTILRSAFFCQNFSEGAMLDGVLAGEVAFPAGQVAEPFIDTDDIADVAVAALTDDSHASKTYDLTGPRLVTFAEATSEIAHATGRDVRYVPVSNEQYAEALAPHLPAEIVSFLTELFRELLDGHNAHLSHDVERILGRKPRDFRTYAREAAASGAWGRVFPSGAAARPQP